MEVGSCFTGDWCYWGLMMDLIKLTQFQGSDMSPGLSQDFMDGYIKP